MPPVNTSETLDLLKNAQAAPNDAIAKNYTQASGLVAYSLEQPAKSVYSVLTPLRNEIPRVVEGIGTATNWKMITAINPSKFSAVVSEGNRGAVIDQTLVDLSAPFRAWGFENAVSFEAQYASKGFDDARARAALQMLQATMIAEEAFLFGGNRSMNLGTTPTPTLTASTTGGTIATGTASVICAALTHAGFNRSSVAGGLVAVVTKTNADGTTDTHGGGVAQKSANATVAVTGSTGSVSATVAPVIGAVAYAWYVGAAGSERLAAITTINSVVLASYPGASQLASALPASDNSTNALIFDGFLTYAAAASINGQPTGAYQKALPSGTVGTGTGFTSDGAGGIAELSTAFQFYWDNYRISPDVIYCSGQEIINLTKKVIANGGVPLVHYQLDAASGRNPDVNAGARLRAILNPFTQSWVELQIHPNAPAGTLLLRTRTVPYPTNGIADLCRMLLRQDYYQLEWPMRSRKYEFGVYADGLFQHYAPFTLGIISNVGNV